jgi:8-oxo-dGTP diphosphatase
MLHSTIHVVCAVIEKNDLVLCAQRSEHMALPLKWEFPGGKIEPNEEEEAALQREILEELNASIEIMERMPEHVHAYTPEKEIRLIPYRCTLAIGATLNAREHAELRWVSKSDLLSLDWAAADVPVVHDVMRMI